MAEALVNFICKQPQATAERYVNAYIPKIEGIPGKKAALLDAFTAHLCRPEWYTHHGHMSWRGKVMLKLIRCCVKDNSSVTVPAPKTWLPATKALNLALLPFQAYADGVFGAIDTTWVHQVLLHLATTKHASVDMWPATLGALARFLVANDAAALKQTKDETAQGAAVHVAHLLTRAALELTSNAAQSSSKSSGNDDGGGGDGEERGRVWDEPPRAFKSQDQDIMELEDLGAVLAVLWLKPQSNAARVFLVHMCNTLLRRNQDQSASVSSPAASSTASSSAALAQQEDVAVRFGFAVILKQFTRPQVKAYALQVLAQFTSGRDRVTIVQRMMPWLKWPLHVDTSVKLPQQSRTKGISVAVWVTELLTQMGKLRDTSPDELRWLAGACGSRILNACMVRENAAGNIQVFRVLFLGVDGIATEVEELLPKLNTVIAANSNNRDFLLTANVVCSALAMRYPHLSTKLEEACAPARELSISPMRDDLCKRFIHFNTFSFKDTLPATAVPLLQPMAPSSSTTSVSTAAARASTAPRSLTSITPGPIAPQPRSLSQPAGLRNLGNTCYLNSVVQALYSLARFRRDVVSLTPSLMAPKSPVLYHAAQLFQQLATHPENIIVPTTFVQRVRPPWFAPGQQQDSAEFLQYFLDVMHTEYEALAPADRQHSNTASPLNKQRAKIGGGARAIGEKRAIKDNGDSNDSTSSTKGGSSSRDCSQDAPAHADAAATSANHKDAEAGVCNKNHSNGDSGGGGGGVRDCNANGTGPSGRGEPMDLTSDASGSEVEEVASWTNASGEERKDAINGISGHGSDNAFNEEQDGGALSQSCEEDATMSNRSARESVNIDINGSSSSSSNSANINGIVKKGDAKMANGNCAYTLPAPLTLLTGKTRKTTTCSECSTPSVRTEEFFLLQLPLPEQPKQHQQQQQRTTMADLLRYYLEDETLEGDNKYKCDACDEARVATVTTELSALPPYLLLTINRFRYDKATRTRKKVTTPVSLTRRLCVPQTSTSGEVVESVYRLQAVVVHTGSSAYSGHYYCFACLDHGWYNLNDSFVQKIEESTLESKLGGTNCAYIVMYARDDDENEADPQPPRSTITSTNPHGAANGGEGDDGRADAQLQSSHSCV